MKVVSSKIEAHNSNDIEILHAHTSIAEHFFLLMTKYPLAEQALHELDPLWPRMRNRSHPLLRWWK